MAQTDIFPLHLQINEVLKTIILQQQTSDMRQRQAEDLHVFVRAETTSLWHEIKDLTEKLDYAIASLQADVGALRITIAERERSIDSLVLAIDSLRRPVSEIVALRSRVGGMLFALGLIGSVLLWFSEPIYRAFVEGSYFKR